MKRKYIILIIIGAIFVLVGIATSLLKSISGMVADAETGKPIEGAVVLAEWTRRVGIGDYHTVSVRVGETFTDKEGKFWTSGPIHPFADPPSVTVYKKGYVAWNNKFIFPDYAHRKQSQDMYGKIRLDHFKENYSHNKHTLFIGTCSSDAFAGYKKKKFAAAYQWELDQARKEILGEK